MNYKDLVPYLTQTKVSVSNYNNAANSTWDDFFTARLYKGDIYKTTNLQNRTLSQYCPTDSAMVKEQKRIEKELVDFEKTLYGRDLIEETDSVSTASGIKQRRLIRRKGGVTMLLQPKVNLLPHQSQNLRQVSPNRYLSGKQQPRRRQYDDNAVEQK